VVGAGSQDTRSYAGSGNVIWSLKLRKANPTAAAAVPLWPGGRAEEGAERVRSHLAVPSHSHQRLSTAHTAG
jgi:hypothetical protein